jgi:hypothetical protein
VRPQNEPMNMQSAPNAASSAVVLRLLLISGTPPPLGVVRVRSFPS